MDVHYRRLRLGLGASILALVSLPAAVSGADLYVDASAGADGNDGLSWATAVATVGRALQLATATPEADLVSVAEGTYLENVLVPSGVALEGGYPRGGGARDPVLHPSVLDGGGTGPVLSVGPGASGVRVDGFQLTNGNAVVGGGGVLVDGSEVTLLDNHIHDNQVSGDGGTGGGVLLLDPASAPGPVVLSGNRIGGNRVLSGNGGGIAVVETGGSAGPGVVLTRNLVEGNYAGGGGPGLGRGGGVYVRADPSRITDNRVLDNQAVSLGGASQTGNGGGIFLTESDAVVTNNLVRGNAALAINGNLSGSGGGVYGYGFSGEISGNSILGNFGEGGIGSQSGFGGGLFLYEGAPVVTGNTIRGNVLEASGCSSGRGGGVYLYGTPATLRDNVVTGNRNLKAGGPGSGPCWDIASCRCFLGGGLWSYQSAPGLALEGNRFEGNVAAEGGGMVLAGSSSCTLTHERIRANTASKLDGGGIEVFFTDPTLSNVEVTDNSGDGIILLGTAGDPAVASFGNVTIAHNGLSCPGRSAPCGFGLYTRFADGLDVRNSILYGNGIVDWLDGLDGTGNPSTTVFAFAGCDVGDGVLGGPGNISADPVFARGPFGTHYLGAVSSGQPADSPCRDAGTDLASVFGLDGRTTSTDDRPDAGTVDMGFHAIRVGSGGEVVLWDVARDGEDLVLRYTLAPGADGHRVYRGDLLCLRPGDPRCAVSGYTHTSPFTASTSECDVPFPISVHRLDGEVSNGASAYYLVVPFTGAVEGSFGQRDLDGDGVPDGERTRPEDSATDEVRNNCP